MAWLVAFNEGRFDEADVETIPQLLSELAIRQQHSLLTLDSPRQQWCDAVATWIPADRSTLQQ